MRLYYFSGSTLPSAYANAVHVMKMCQAFVKACGHDVTLFAKAGDVPDRVERAVDLFSYYDVAPVFKVNRIKKFQNTGFSGPARIVGTLYQALKGRPPPDLVYGRDYWTVAGAVALGWPAAFEAHEMPHAMMEAALLRFILSAKNFKGLVTITEGLKYDMLRWCSTLDERKIFVAPDGADVPQEPLVPVPLDVPVGTSVQMGYAGSLYAGKGIELILEMAALMPEGGFHIFGGKAQDVARWKAQNVSKNVVFYGYVPHSAVKHRLAACDILLAPYLPEIQIGTGADIGRWISPLKLFEYMAVRKPIVCSDLSILSEIMGHEENCLRASPYNPDEWVHLLRKLTRDEGLRARLVAQGWHDLETRYSWEKRAQNICRFLKSAKE